MTELNFKVDRNTVLILCAILLVLTFLAGRYSAPTPPPPVYNDFCKKDIDQRKIAEGNVTQLKGDLETQKELLTTCQNDCDTRLRDRVDLKDAEKKAAVVDAKKKQKDRYVQFKCRQCVRKGLCK